MPAAVVPESGWALGAAVESISNSKAPGTPNIAPGTKQLMRLQFTESSLLLDLIKAGEFKVSFGKTIVSWSAPVTGVPIDRTLLDIFVWQWSPRSIIKKRAAQARGLRNRRGHSELHGYNNAPIRGTEVGTGA